MRNTLDRILQLGIKLCMLTGVAFVFAACYGPAPDRWMYEDPEWQQDQQQLEQQVSAMNPQEEEKDVQ
ncbi:MAG: hypothetical protein II644_02850 [Paludibacteraceae bacterium]|nr:hypothetical protein [Paludibacteraceae bacterium]